MHPTNGLKSPARWCAETARKSTAELVERPNDTGLPRIASNVERTSWVFASASVPATTPRPCGHWSRNFASPLAGTATHGPSTGMQRGMPLHSFAAPRDAGHRRGRERTENRQEDELARRSHEPPEPDHRERGTEQDHEERDEREDHRHLAELLRIDQMMAQVLVDLAELARRVRLVEVPAADRRDGPERLRLDRNLRRRAGTVRLPYGIFCSTLPEAVPSDTVETGIAALRAAAAAAAGVVRPAFCPPSESSRIVAGGCGWPGLLGPTAFFATLTACCSASPSAVPSSWVVFGSALTIESRSYVGGTRTAMWLENVIRAMRYRDGDLLHEVRDRRVRGQQARRLHVVRRHRPGYVHHQHDGRAVLRLGQLRLRACEPDQEQRERDREQDHRDVAARAWERRRPCSASAPARPSARHGRSGAGRARGRARHRPG